MALDELIFAMQISSGRRSELECNVLLSGHREIRSWRKGWKAVNRDNIRFDKFSFYFGYLLILKMRRVHPATDFNTYTGRSMTAYGNAMDGTASASVPARACAPCFACVCERACAWNGAKLVGRV